MNFRRKDNKTLKHGENCNEVKVKSDEERQEAFA